MHIILKYFFYDDYLYNLMYLTWEFHICENFGLFTNRGVPIYNIFINI